MKSSLKINPLHTLLLCGILSIPFMSLPVMPSDYRPISVFFFFPVSIFIYYKYLSRLEMKKDILVLSFFVLFSILHSIFLQPLTTSLRAIVPLVLGFFSYVGMNYYFQRNKVSKIFNKLITLFVFIAILGVIEILSMKNIIPYSIKQFIGEVFSGKVSGRMQLITMEGSWAAKVIIFSIPIYVYHYCQNGYFYMSFYILLILFVLIFSLEGFAILGVALLFRFFPVLFKLIAFKYKLKHYLYVSLILVISFFLMQFILRSQSGYHISRLYTFLDSKSFLEVLSLDASTFIRVVYPTIGFLIFWDNPFGVGLGGYAESFNSYIKTIPVNYSHFNEVIGDIKTISADPKNLYSKIASETGIIGIVFFLSFLLLQLKYLRCNIIYLPRYKLFFLTNFLLGITCVIQFGSFGYLPFWFAFAVNSAIYFRYRKGLTI